MDTIEKVYCTGHDNNDALVSAFYPELLNEHQCIKYATAVANDKDGYTGIQFCRWVADVVGKKENIDWDKFK